MFIRIFLMILFKKINNFENTNIYKIIYKYIDKLVLLKDYN